MSDSPVKTSRISEQLQLAAIVALAALCVMLCVAPIILPFWAAFAPAPIADVASALVEQDFHLMAFPLFLFFSCILFVVLGKS